MTKRRGRRRKKLLDDLKDRRGYCLLKEETLDRTVWRNRFGRGFGPVVWQITDDDDDDDDGNDDRFNYQNTRSRTPCLRVQSGHFDTSCEKFAWVKYEIESGSNNQIILGLHVKVSEMWLGFMCILFESGYNEEDKLSRTSSSMKFYLSFHPWITYLKHDRLFQKSMFIDFIVAWNNDVPLPPNATTCPLWTSWSSILGMAGV